MICFEIGHKEERFIEIILKEVLEAKVKEIINCKGYNERYYCAMDLENGIIEDINMNMIHIL